MPYNKEELKREARERFGVTEFRPGQAEILNAVMSGRDTLGLLPTGAGKSLCYQLPSLFLPKPTLVVSPLISLMQDQQEKLEEADVEVARLDSTLTASETRETVEEISQGEQTIIYVTPERLENPKYLEVLASHGVSLFVVDEAHCISQWGHDFRPSYLALRDALRQLGRPPILAVTATATPDVANDIVTHLGMDNPLIVSTGVDRANLFWEVRRTVNSTEKAQQLSEILRSETGSGIIYVATVKLADELYETLKTNGFNVARYHGKMPTKEREETQRAFMDGEYQVIVATNAFGLGVDKEDIRFVIHYNFTNSLESYYQEAGRAGRDGNRARAILLYRLEDRRIQAYFLGGKYPKREESLKFYRLVGADPAPLKTLAAAAGTGERRARVLVAQLESAGIVSRSRRGIHKLRDFASTDDFDSYLAAYEERHMSDRKKLRTMMDYAEGTMCRTIFISRYFNEELTSDCCEHCDNCRDRAARRLPQVRRAEVGAKSVREPERSQWHEGDEVAHRQFGKGKVEKVEGENLTVAFWDGGTRRVRSSYVKPAPSPVTPR
ncbi:ATP-dependent DNA helicase [Geomonas sp. RF6]|uniref:RecQ family ATP-dependent DNA helicase n=1 Tax=Geomonas sp. RF6 TaxID=2897342 RepID=UPI001E2F8CED|nr:ATP-dependent DNA helicase RecQ [Geomonas sp. RF6]UFS69786.1 ATP-dependent DNA helicase [Geomonas sp. RF6]